MSIAKLRLLTAATLFGSTALAQASLIGDTVSASLSGGNQFWVVESQFSSPTVVGAGIEFSGRVSLDAALGPQVAQYWNVTVDVSDSDVLVTWTPDHPGQGPWGCGGYCVGLDLTDLAGDIGGLSLVSGPAGQIQSLASSASSSSVRWNSFSGGQFDFRLPASQVPEPASLGLVAAALLSATLARRRNGATR
jgi:hypothetical protein